MLGVGSLDSGTCQGWGWGARCLRVSCSFNELLINCSHPCSSQAAGATALFPVVFMVQRSQLHHCDCGGPGCQSAQW